MIRKARQPKIFLKNTLAAFLMITLSGAYCLFCCQPIEAAESKVDHCPIKKVSPGEHCDFSKNKASEPSEAASSVQAFECCGLKFNFFVAKLEKNDRPQKTPVLARNSFNFLKSVKLVDQAGFTDLPYRAPDFERAALHVRNCVFRI
jgi:hypothetical protein